MQQLRAARIHKKARKEERDSEEGIQKDKSDSGELPNELLVRVNDESEEGAWFPGQDNTQMGALSDMEDEEGDNTLSASEDEEEITDNEEEITDDEGQIEYNTSAFEILFTGAKTYDAFQHTSFIYQRGPEPSVRTMQRTYKKEQQQIEAAKNTYTLETYFQRPHNRQPNPVSHSILQISRDKTQIDKRLPAIVELEKKLSQQHRLNGQNLMRHQVVLAFLKVQQQKKPGETREQLATIVARCFGKGIYFARRIVSWEIEWVEDRLIPEGKRGCFAKIRSWFNDEGVQQAIRDWLSSQKVEDITAFKLAKVIGEYLDSNRATMVVEDMLLFKPTKNRIRARTARKWLKLMGLTHSRYTKGVYVDGHEREDVVLYRNNVFLPLWKQFSQRFVVFEEDGSWQPPPGLMPGEKPIVFITHDESAFNANDGKRQGWMKKGEQPLRPKTKGKGIMVSGFLTPGGRLKVPDHIPDSELLNNPMWVIVDGAPIRDSMWYLEYGKDNYWTGDKMIEHTIRVALPIFHYAFPGCQALFAFDNASNHCAFSDKALVASKMNLNPGGRQPHMREGFDYARGLPHSMVFSDHHLSQHLRGKPKGLEVVLRERNLWPANGRRNDGFKFLLQCPKRQSGLVNGCDPGQQGGCCARTLMAAQQDFREQKSRLEEELVAANQLVIFYPKFHCEVNFIEKFWCSAKWYARENCQFSLEGLRHILPQALDSVSTATIHRHYNHCKRVIEAYAEGFSYGTNDFTDRVYKGHRQVVDKSKW